MLAKLGGGNDDELLRSIQLCDRYLNSCNNTDAGLAVLKDEVKKILAGKVLPPPCPRVQAQPCRAQLSSRGPAPGTGFQDDARHQGERRSQPL